MIYVEHVSSRFCFIQFNFFFRLDTKTRSRNLGIRTVPVFGSEWKDKRPVICVGPGHCDVQERLRGEGTEIPAGPRVYSFLQ